MKLIKNRSSGEDYSNTKSTNNLTRIGLTGAIVIYAFIILIALSLVILFATGASIDDKKFVFTAIVPLVASWVGTVLAFYYGRENFEAAASKILGLSKETLDDLNVINIMILTKTMVTWTYDHGKSELEDILEIFKKVDKDRIPFLDSDQRPKYMVHRHQMEKYYLSQKIIESQSGDDKVETESDSLQLIAFFRSNESKFGYKQKNGFVTINRDSTIQRALEIMKSVDGCKDIFVTENGTADSPVIGWITDVLVTRFLTVK